jgi:hypothetical protein
MERLWNDTEGENGSTRTRTCPSATLSNINPTWTGVELKPVLFAEMPANYYGFNLGLFDVLYSCWEGTLVHKIGPFVVTCRLCMRITFFFVYLKVMLVTNIDSDVLWLICLQYTASTLNTRYGSSNCVFTAGFNVQWRDVSRTEFISGFLSFGAHKWRLSA